MQEITSVGIPTQSMSIANSMRKQAHRDRACRLGEHGNVHGAAAAADAAAAAMEERQRHAMRLCNLQHTLTAGCSNMLCTSWPRSMPIAMERQTPLGRRRN